MRYELGRVLAVVLLLPHAALAAEKSPDSARAEILFEEGRRLMASGDFASACPKFANSEALEPATGTALNLAVCFEKFGKLASAWAAFKSAESLAAAAGQKDRADTARQHAAQLEPQVSRLTIAVPAGSQAAGLEIQRDDERILAAEWGVPVPRDGGTYGIRATAPGKKPWSRSVSLESSGQTLVVEVPPLDDLRDTTPIADHSPPPRPVATTPAEAAAPPPAATPGRAQRIAGIAVAGAGALALGAGGVLGLVAKSHDNAALDENGASRHNDSANAVNLGNAATAVVVVGGVAAAAGAVVWFAAPRAHVAVGVSDSEVLLRGAF